MKTVTLGVASVEATKRRMAAAFDGEAQGAFVSFTSIELLWKVLDPQKGIEQGVGSAIDLAKLAYQVARTEAPAFRLSPLIPARQWPPDHP